MDFLEMFFEELREKGNESINDIKSFLESRDGALINDIYRLFHTIKGSASLVGLVGYKNLFHKIEDYFKSYLAGQGELSDEFLSRLLSIIPPLLERDGDLSESEVQDLIDRLEGKKEAETTIFSKEQGALSVEDVQEFLSMALTTENSLMRGDINSALRIIRLAKSKLTSTIQELYYTKLRNILSNFDTLIVQEATNAKKKVRLNLEIGDEMVEKKDSKALIDILVHLVRNSISHGIESPDERKKIGKDEIGVITIRSYVLNNELYLEVEDDGQGIDFEKVRKKAMERNLGHLRPEDVIFVPRFSTKEEADGTAGRGVGLDAVKNFAMARGGDVEFVTTPGIGTRFIIHFPVKSFLIKVLVLEADGQQFCISTQDVLEIVTKLKAIDGKVKYKDKVCDVVYKSSNPRFGIITRNYRAIFVDNIVGIFDGQVSSESYPSVKGFVKNVYVYPLPIIDIDSFREGEVKKTKKINVLLVDDSVVTRSVVSKFLEAFGYEVIEAKNGSEAISYVESSNCDVVVCDVEMPDIDGFETTRRIKQIKKDLPVILFSTLSKEQLAKGLEVGADAYLSKEESPERLLRLIEKLVG